MRLPGFLIVGGQKCGTTAARFNLGQHPHIAFTPSAPNQRHELHFFDNEQSWPCGVDWYATHFSQSAPLIGETAPNYLSSTCAKRIYTTLPNARLIVLLRNPVDRAYSH